MTNETDENWSYPQGGLTEAAGGSRQIKEASEAAKRAGDAFEDAVLVNDHVRHCYVEAVRSGDPEKVALYRQRCDSALREVRDSADAYVAARAELERLKGAK